MVTIVVIISLEAGAVHWEISSWVHHRAASLRARAIEDLLDCTRRNLESHGDPKVVLSALCNRVTTDCSDPWVSGCPP